MAKSLLPFNTSSGDLSTSHFEVYGQSCRDRETFESTPPCSLDRFTLTYVPPSFQHPYQLLHLRCVLIHHRLIRYAAAVALLETNCSAFSLEPYVAIVGLSRNGRMPECFFSVESSSCHSNDILSVVLGCGDELAGDPTVFLDTLDVGESLSGLLARMQDGPAQTAGVEDGRGLDTLLLEMQLYSLAQELEAVSHGVFSSIIRLPGQAVCFSEAVLTLRQFVYWISSTQLGYLAASCETEMGRMFSFDRVPGVLFAHQDKFNPLCILQWYQSHHLSQIISMVSGEQVRHQMRVSLQQMLPLNSID